MLPPPIDTRTHRVLSGVSRVAILDALRTSDEPLDIATLAERVGLHINTTRGHLDQLVEAGFVERTSQVRTTPGRPKILFAAAGPSAEKPGDSSYRILAEILAEQLSEAEPTAHQLAVDAGRRWGRQLSASLTAQAGGPTDDAPVDVAQTMQRLVALLDETGFAPELTSEPAASEPVIELHHCPFEEIAQQHADIVCSVHLGLMQGALEQMEAPIGSTRLEPLVAPGLCRSYLKPAGDP